MVNLGICRKCNSCEVFSPAYVGDDGQKTKRSWVECGASGMTEMLGWDSALPEKCPYVLEHKLTEEALDDLEEEDDDDDA